MSQKCELCGGTGRKTFLIKHQTTQMWKTVIQWCICTKSKLISENPHHKILAGLGDSFIPLDQVDPQLEFHSDKLDECPNYLILSETDDISFRFHIKGIIMKHGFMSPPVSFYCCDSIDVLKKFYVQQDDGSSPSLSDLNRYDLVVIILGANEKNDQLKTCIAQVIYNRLTARKPIWIYLRVPIGNCIQERSPELEEYLKNFKSVTLRNTRREAPVKNSKVREKAEVSPYFHKD